MDVRASARHNIASQHMLSAGECVVVAVSGGPDSLCLLHVLCSLCGELSLRLHVAHLNHGLRGDDALADAERVAMLAREWGVTATIEQADVRGYQAMHRLSLEEAARQVRYAFLQRVAAGAGAQAIAVGHTADDQVETILMHWLRGAGLTGLRGMQPVQPWFDGVRLIRPLLDVHRADVEAYCADHNLQPRRDRSNEDEHIWRNRLRRRVLPLLEQVSPSIRQTMLRTARILAEEDAYVDGQLAALWPALARTEPGATHVDAAQWRAQPPALQRRIIRKAWAHVSASYDDLSWQHVEHIRELLLGARTERGATVHLPHGARATVRPDSLAIVGDRHNDEQQWDAPLLMQDSVPLPAPGRLSLPDTDWLVETELGDDIAIPEPGQAVGHLVERFDADVVGSSLALRCWRAGDRMQPLGMVGTRKIHDIMVDERIPRQWRRHVPLLVAGEQILWLVGARRSEWAKVSRSTRRVLTVCIRRMVAPDA